jgi:hypothetical protein
MTVVDATHGVKVAPDHVYVIQPNTSVAIADGVLSVTPRPDDRRPHYPVDHFLRSLAAVQGPSAIGVILAMRPPCLRQPSLRYLRNLTALTTSIALCSLIVVSGPHLVHHFPEQHVLPDRLDAVRHQHHNHTPTDSPHHEDAAPHQANSGSTSDASSHGRHPTSWPDCFILFLMQYTPITWGFVAFLLLQVLIVSITVATFCPPSATRWQLTPARAPPFSSLFA